MVSATPRPLTSEEIRPKYPQATCIEQQLWTLPSNLFNNLELLSKHLVAVSYVAQEVITRLLTVSTEGQVQFQATPCGICGG